MYEEHGFWVHCPTRQRTFYFYAKTANEQVDWIQNIRHNLEVSPTKGTAPVSHEALLAFGAFGAFCPWSFTQWPPDFFSWIFFFGFFRFWAYFFA